MPSIYDILTILSIFFRIKATGDKSAGPNHRTNCTLYYRNVSSLAAPALFPCERSWEMGSYTICSHRSRLSYTRAPSHQPQNINSDKLGRDHLPNSDVRSFHAGHVAEGTTKPRQHARRHGLMLTLSGGWSWPPRNFGANSAFGRGLMMPTNSLTVAYISLLSTLLTWPKIILSSVVTYHGLQKFTRWAKV